MIINFKTLGSNKFVALVAILLYSLLISSCGGSDDSDMEMPDEPEEIYELEEGGYTGVFTADVTQGESTFQYTLGVSMRIEKSATEDKYEGVFYFSGNFTPNNPALGDDNGRFNFRINENRIQRYFHRKMPRGSCPPIEPNWSGSGRMTANNEFEINFTGDDCDGSYVGKIELKKHMGS